MKRLILILLAALMPLGVFAEDAEQSIDAVHLEPNFVGWKGIVFLCVYEEDEILKQVCQRAKTDIELLAAAFKINLTIARDNNYFDASTAEYENSYLPLEYYLKSTKHDNAYAVKAVYGQIGYKLTYTVVEPFAEKGSVRSMPRSAEVVLWSNDLIGSGVPDASFVTIFSNHAETQIKKAITLYLKHNKP